MNGITDAHIVWRIFHDFVFSEHRKAAVEQSTLKLEKAIASYEKTLKQFPDCADGHALYAQVSINLKEEKLFPDILYR